MNGTKRTTWLARLTIAGGLAAMAPLGWHVAARDRGDVSSLDRTTTAAVAGEPRGLQDLAGTETAPGEAVRLREGLEALAAGDLGGARAIRDDRGTDTLDRRILFWAIALDGGRAVTSAEIADAATNLAAWPGEAALRRNLERALYRERAEPEAVIAALGDGEMRTIEGAIALARAFRSLGDTEHARTAIGSAWRWQRLDAAAENAVIAEFGAIIAAPDHRIRMETMLHHDRIASAGRVASLAGAEALWRAWSAVIRGEKNSAALLDAVPEAQRSAGHAFATARLLRKEGKVREAAAAMLAAPADAGAIEPETWWQERRALSRELLDLGDAATAYALAAAQTGGSPTTRADAEFHAGWYALRGLRDATKAAAHFARIAGIAEGPISRARAFYWLGRAAEAGGPGDAGAFDAQAAAYGATFYGQLAAARLGRQALEIAQPQPTGDDAATFRNREAVQAIARLEAAGDADRAGFFYRDLAERLTAPGEVALLAARADARGDRHLALRVAKIAAGRGIDVGLLSHPLGAIPDGTDTAEAGEALAYAVARQESEFNPAAVSRAGARGLLQLLPGTARDMARKRGVDFSADRLTADASYNATLGAAFLAEQLRRFDGSYVLAIAGYNAGPRRAVEWTKRYGDPRGADLDTVVDWIERIPFTETRSYVQRVMENYQVYKMRLSGRFDIAGDLVEGR
ncbi:soluble lytic murein transglycosylase [Rhizobiaceae bacterium]|nr:soluble lytic murein transglycosylase [Rhizobiaceae bacterium]